VSDNITLPRDHAEKLLKVVLDLASDYPLKTALMRSEERTALAALDAALAEPPAKREPATHGEISEKFYNAGSDRYYRQADYRLGWRAAERFHGIRKEDGK
jgi:hypothetical protein